MAKKKSNAANAARQLESKVSPILEINYSDPLFCIAAHPTKPILAQGFATGHVFCSSYNAEVLEQQQQTKRQEIMEEEMANFKKGNGEIIRSVSQSKKKWWTIIEDHNDIEDANIKTMWKTKRHKGSCRSILFDPLENSLGEHIYSVGTDHIIKKANTETGKVISKVKVEFPGNNDAVTKLCHSSTLPLLLVGTENGHVLVYDSSNLAGGIKYKVSNAHEDSINHILAMPAVSAYHYLSIGSTTLAHIDIRKGVITQSDDQEDELLSMCYATDHLNDNKNDTVLVSQGEGVVTIWKNSKNRYMDQLTRIKVNKGVSLDCIIPTMNNDTDDSTNSVWCGDSEGLLHRINHKLGKIVETRVHSSKKQVDEVGNLEIDYNYRLISSGMDSLKIWSEQVGESVDGEGESLGSGSDDDSDDDGGSDSDGSISDSNSLSASDGGNDTGSDGENDLNSEEEDSDENSEEEEEEEEDAEEDIHIRKSNPPKRLQKTKRKLIDLNKTETPEAPDESQPKKPKAKQLTNKQLRNLQQHEHGIRKFEDL